MPREEIYINYLSVSHFRCAAVRILMICVTLDDIGLNIISNLVKTPNFDLW